MKPMRKDVSEKRLERENRVAKIFHDLGDKELTIEGTVDKYLEKYEDDQVMNYRIMSCVLKDMSDSKMLHKERRFIKENKNGRIEPKTVIYYKESKLAASVFNEAEKALVKSSIPPTTNKMGMRITDPDISSEDVKEVTEVVKPAVKKNTVQDLMSRLSFAEALEKLYTGHKIVSAVSGNIYVIIRGKGITSTTNPGAIITEFPPLEIEGSWRIMEAPKGCPYCGDVVKLIHENLGEKAYYYCCVNPECAAHGPRAQTPELAVVKFNERV